MADVPSIRHILIDEIAAETAGTRKTLARIPQERWDWAPHEKSMTMGRLAGWVARSLALTPAILARPTMDMAQEGGLPPAPATAAQLLPTFDAAVAAATAALEAASDASMAEPWSMQMGEQTVWGPVPKYGVLRGFVLADLIHHRAQLGVYLRLLGVAVPAVYGPSADEQA